MQVLIISTNRNQLPAPVLPAGACLVAEAAERAGHTVSLLDLMFAADPLKAVINRLQGRKYDCIGLSVRNIDNNDREGTKFYIRELVPLIAAIRENSSAPVVLGGAALGVMPRSILQFLGETSAVVGEGEIPFVRLLERMIRGEAWDDLPGVAILKNGIFRQNPLLRDNVLQCTVPDYRRWLDIRAYRSQLATVPLQTKLGCRFRCVYCTYSRIEGETYRLADPESVSEAAQRITASGMRNIEFVDNVFNAPRDHAVAVCEAFIRGRVRARFQSVELNPAGFDDELLDVMKRAGFTGIGLTVESAADPVLQGLRKGFTAPDVHRAAATVRKHSLPCVWIFMLGGPGETGNTVRETLRFAADTVRPQDVAFFNTGIRIYPGTELETIARKEGVLTRRPEDMLEPVFYVSPHTDPLRIQRLVRQALNEHMNFMSVNSFSFPYLPLIHKFAYRLGVGTPLWRHTRLIRRGLRFLGMDA